MKNLNKIIQLSIFAIIVSIMSCKKAYVDDLDFDVNVDKTTYKLNENIRFYFSGNPSTITFWSGAAPATAGGVGQRYEYRARTILDTSESLPIFNFESHRQQNTTQPGSLRVLITKNLLGRDSTRVRNTNWVDITNRATIATTNAWVASGNINLSEFMTGDSTIYIAFKYVGNAGTVSQPTWTLRNITVKNMFVNSPTNDFQFIVDKGSNAGFTALSFRGTQAWTPGDVPALTGAAVSATVTSVLENEDWLISKPLRLNSVAPEVGIAVKNFTETKPYYDFVATAPGTYFVTFVARTQTTYTNQEIVKQIAVTVER